MIKYIYDVYSEAIVELKVVAVQKGIGGTDTLICKSRIYFNDSGYNENTAFSPHPLSINAKEALNDPEELLSEFKKRSILKKLKLEREVERLSELITLLSKQPKVST